MIDVEARGRHEAALLREEAGRVADTEAALQSVLAGEVVVPLELRHSAAPRSALARRPVSRRRWIQVVAAMATVAAFVVVLASRPGDDPGGATSGRTRRSRLADGLVVLSVDPPIECERDVCPPCGVGGGHPRRL